VRHEVLLRTSDGRRSILIDDDLCRRLRGVELDNKESLSLFLSSWISLLADSPLQSYNKPYRLYRKFLTDILNDGIKATVIRYSDLAHKLVSQQVLTAEPTSIGEWIDDFKETPVFFEYHRYYSTGDPDILKFLYTFLCFGKKQFFVDESFNDVAFRNWSGIEDRLADLSLEPSDIKSLKTILSKVLPRFSIKSFEPKFGPGSVSESGIRRRNQKIRHLSFDPYIDRFLIRGLLSYEGRGKELGLSSNIIPNVKDWSPASGVSSRISRLRFVPKNLKTSRSICMEPNTLMFFQQGILSTMTRLIHESSLNRFIRLKDQSYNRDLACYGSYTGNIDTIDLSSASDSVSLKLVKGIFPPGWLLSMLTTRSHSAYLPDGSLRALNKFAPMGSALCFPTQCIIFASVSIYAACILTHRRSYHTIPFHEWLESLDDPCSLFNIRTGYHTDKFEPLGIYGDDICIDSRLTDIVKAILSRLGFTINDDKSFVGGQAFRESCGGFFLNGVDITPLMFRIKDIGAKLTPNMIMSFLHLINDSWLRSYKNMYRFLHNSLMYWNCRRGLVNKTSAKNAIPYTIDAHSFGILCSDPKNSHLRVRFNKDYQRNEYRSWSPAIADIYRDDDILSFIDKYEYNRWWSSRHDDSDYPNERVSRDDSGGSGIKWRWIPLY